MPQGETASLVLIKNHSDLYWSSSCPRSGTPFPVILIAIPPGRQDRCEPHSTDEKWRRRHQRTCLRPHRAEGTGLGLGSSNERETQPGQSDTAGALACTSGKEGVALLWGDWAVATVLPGWVACLVLPGALHWAHPHLGRTTVLAGIPGGRPVLWMPRRLGSHPGLFSWSHQPLLRAQGCCWAQIW